MQPSTRRRSLAVAFVAVACGLAAADALAQAPAAPTGVTATPGDTEVALAWTAPSGTITGYDYSADDGGTWTAVPSSGASTTCYAVTGLTNGAARTFRVRAKNGSNNGAASASARATPSATSERAALIAIYDGTAGASWNDGTNWKSCRPLNDWYGVTATAAGGVTALNLANDNLDGSIPASIGNLTALTSLWLLGNSLSGSIPSLDGLTALRSLRLFDNDLSGSIPSLDRLTNLRELQLHRNDLSGSIPSLDKLTSLQWLYLHGNDLTGSIPSLDGLTSLQRLNLSDNDLSGSIPPLDKLTNLQWLMLFGNDLSGSIPPLDGLTALQWLILTANDLSGSIPPLDRLTNLTWLELSENRLSGAIPPLDQLTQLSTALGLGKNRLTGAIPPLDRLTRLRRLDLRDNRLTGKAPAAIAQMTRLRKLFLGNNQLSGSLPRGLTSLTTVDEFSWQGSGLCSPPYAAFRAWMQGIATHSAGPECAIRLTLTPDPASVAEGGSATVTAAIVGETTAATAVTLTAAGVSPTEPSDFTLQGASIHIPAGIDPGGATTATLQTATDADALHELVLISATVVNASDTIEASATAAVTITDDQANDANRPPVFTQAVYDFSLPANRDGRQTPLALGVAAATDPDGDELTWDLVTGDGSRFAVRAEDGAVLYAGPGEDVDTEPNRFVLRVRVRDARGGQALALVDVRVVAAAAGGGGGAGGGGAGGDAGDDGPPGAGGGVAKNRPLRAADDEATTREDEPAAVNVLANDVDPDGDALEVTRVSKPANGTAAVNGGVVSYAPAANWHGTDRFLYEVSDGNGSRATAAVTVTVLPMNDAPAAVGTIADRTLDEGGAAATVDLAPYFEDIDGDALTYSAVVSDPGVVAAAVAGAVLTLAPAEYGSAAVTVTAEDAGGLSATQRFAVGVSDRLARAVLEDTLAALARSHLASARMMLGRRGASGSARERSRLTVRGRDVPLDEAAARRALGRAAEQFASGWLSRARSLARASGGHAAQGPGMDPGAGLAGAGPAAGVGGSGGYGDLGDLAGLGGLGGFGGGHDDTWLRGTEFLLAWGGREMADGAGGAEGEPEAGRRWQVWGQGDLQTFQNAPAAATGYDGGLRTGWVGFDASLTERWMLGVAVARSDGTGDWRAGAVRGSLTTTLTAVHPWVQWSDGATSVLASAGGGWGKARNVRQSGRTGASDLDLRQGLAEVRRLLVAGGVELSVRADVAWARLSTAAGDETVDAQRAEVNQTRAGLEVTAPARLGGLVAPFAEVHVRRDGGAGQTGTGVEVLGGLRAARGRLQVEAQGRMLVLYSAADYGEQGVGLTVSVGNRSQEGLSLSLSPRWGDEAAGSGMLWRDQAFGASPWSRRAGAAGPAWGMDASADYGMRLGRGRRLVTWYGAWRQSPYDRGILVGGRMGLPGG